MLPVVRISAKGQIVIPIEIRETYNLRKGDRLMVREEGGRIILEPLERHPILDLRGTYKGKTNLTQVLIRERRADKTREDNEHV